VYEGDVKGEVNSQLNFIDWILIFNFGGYMLFSVI